LLYGKRMHCPPGEDYLVPLGKAAVQREGSDVTIVAYSYMAAIAHQAADLLAQKGVSAEVIDPRTLIPLDTETIINSIKKTNHLACLSQAPETGCFAEHIIREVQYGAFDYLDAPIELVAAVDVPPPMSPPLEAEFIPSPEKLTGKVLAMLGKA